VKNIFKTVVSGACVSLFALTAMAKHKEDEPCQGSISAKHHTPKAELVSLAKIDFQNAMTAALASTQGKVIEGELDTEDGSLVYAFEILNNENQIVEVLIDAGDGKTLETEIKHEKNHQHQKSKDQDDEDGDEEDED